MICFLIFSKDKSCDEVHRLPLVTSDCLSSLTLTKEEETDLAELIAKDCSYSKCFSVLLFRFKGLLSRIRKAWRIEN